MFETSVAVRYIFNSNRLDGISLSEDQTRQIIEGELDRATQSEAEAPDGKSFDLYVVTSHRDALDKVAEVASGGQPITEQTVLELHKTLMGELLLSAGEYRECTLNYKGIKIPSPPETIKPRMDALLNLINGGLKRAEKKDQLAWRVHHEFITIHPFIEANGRMARLLMNLVRLRAGLDVAIVRFEDRERYSKAILEFQEHKLAKARERGGNLESQG